MTRTPTTRRALMSGTVLLTSGLAAACGQFGQRQVTPPSARRTPTQLLAWVGPPVDTIGPGADFRKTTEAPAPERAPRDPAGS